MSGAEMPAKLQKVRQAMNRMFWLVVGLCVALCGGSVSAAEPQVHGFMMATADSASSQVNSHIRLILSGDLTDRLGFRLVGTPVGPLSPISYAELIWKPAVKGVDSVTLGRTFPVFGRSWYFWRVDQVPTVLYSSIYGPNAAEDTGVTVVGHAKRFRWYMGGFAGQPLFGNDPGAAGYFRGEYQVSPALALAISQRFSHVGATGADIVWHQGRLELASEVVSSQDLAQTLVRGQYQLNKRIGLALQREWLAIGPRWTVASTLGLGRYLEVKLGYQTGGRQPGTVIGQLVTRW